jgi:hypothetical protein
MERSDTGAYYTVMRTPESGRRGIILIAAVAVMSLAIFGRSGITAQTPQAIVTPHAVGSLSELMVDVLYPDSDAVFYIATRTPKTNAEWTELQGKILTLAESANLLMMPGRARDADRWMSDAQLLLDAGTAAFAAAKRKDVDALVDLNDQLYTACLSCHQHYRANYGRR